MRVVGYWIEGLSGPLQVCVPQHLVAEPYTDAERVAIVAFLSQGERWEQERGYSWCRFACDAPDEELGSGHWRRGKWAWPDGLAHYVQAHGVRVPQEFERAALAGFPLPNPDSDGHRWWIAWCTERAPQGFAERLEQAREAAAEAAAQAVEKAKANLRAQAREWEREEGTGPTVCCKSGCDRLVLRERRLCGEHLARVEDSSEVRTARLWAEKCALWKFLGIERRNDDPR